MDVVANRHAYLEPISSIPFPFKMYSGMHFVSLRLLHSWNLVWLVFSELETTVNLKVPSDNN